MKSRNTCKSMVDIAYICTLILSTKLCNISTVLSFTFTTQQRRTSLPISRPIPSPSSSSSLSKSSSLFAQVSTAPTERKRDIDYNAARGASLLLEDVSVYRGPAKILTNIQWRVEPRTKWALIGGNGSGKSTLLKAIVDEISSDGDINLGTSNVGYLQQTAVSGSNRTVYDEAASAMTRVEQARQELARTQKALENAPADCKDIDDLVEANGRAMQKFEAAGGYTQEQKVAGILKGLGFEDLQKHCDELSGGWQMRVAFAKLLLSEPTLCLMDEPGNHLDASARKWLANYLATYNGDGTLILVTHDVALLSSMDHIAEITPSGTLQVYKSCTYDQYLELKKQRGEAARAEYERNQQKAAKLQAFVDQWGASATKASAAQSRVKQIQKMQQEGLLDEIPEELVQERFRPSMALPDPPRAIGETLLSLKDAKVGYTEEMTLLSNVNLDINRGMKLLIRGPNGSGKSTILHSLRGTLPLLDGDRVTNPSLHLGVFTQDLAQELDKHARAVDLVTSYARDGYDITISDQDARSAMGRLGLQGEKPLRKLMDLSGGEKARVALAMFGLKPSNLYLLDEVSNHLDIECVEALGEALSDWGADDGAIVVISHDEAFCQKIEFTHVATVRDGALKVERRSARSTDWVVVEPNISQESSQAGDVSMPVPAKSKEEDKKLRKQLFNAPKRIAKLETMVEKADMKIAEIDEEMLVNGSDVGKLVDLTKEKEELEAHVLELMEEWETLEELLANHS